MNTIDKQYQSLLQDILDNGVTKSDRTGTGTISVFGRQIRHKMSDGVPLLTTKKMPFKTIVTELLWFLKGDTNIKYLIDNDCHIWDGDAYKNYTNYPLATIHDRHTNILYQNRDKGWCMLNGRSMVSPHPTRHLSQEEFINKIKTDDEFAKKWGELGPNHFATYAKTIEEAELKDWDVTLNDGLEDEPYVSDDFQIGPDGAYEHTEDWPEDTTPREKAKSELINLLFCQIMDLTTMSKIELGDDVITEIKRLNEIIKIV